MPDRSLELLGDVWSVCNYCDDALDLSQVRRNQSCSLCSCKNLRVTLPEKFVSLTLISCDNVELLLDSLISGLELTNCNNVRVRVKRMLPSCAIDQCQQVYFWISRENAQTILFTSSKSGDMNVNINRGEEGEEDWVEEPLHEQFEHTINEKLKVVSRPSSLYK